MEEQQDPPLSNPNKTLINFYLQIRPLIKLKHSISALNDPHFNPTSLALFEVTHDRLEITVRNPLTHVTAYLCFKKAGLVNFHCCKPIENKIIDLSCIHCNLDSVDDDDTSVVSIEHVDGSNYLCFKVEGPDKKEFKVEMQEMKEEYKKFPEITYACEAVILSQHLRQMISYIQQSSQPEIVSVEITEWNVNLCVGKNTWTYGYDSKIGRTRGMSQGQKHNAWFEWAHCEALKKASYVEVGFVLCLVIDPPNNIMLRFNMKELGDLVFIKEATIIILDSQPNNNNNNTRLVPLPIGLGCLASVASILP